MADNFDLQGWMREQKQGPYAGAKGVEKVALKSSKPKSKTGLNESLMGMIDLKPVGMMSEDMEEDLPRVFLSDKDISGTSFKGQTINCSVNFLKELIGEPQYSENTGTDKTNYEWTCETEDGDVFSIYDWKEGRPIEDNEEIEWHIGAKNGAIANKAKAAIESYMDLNEDMGKGMGDDDDMDDAPEIEDTWNKPSEFDKDDDEEKMAATAMKQVKSSKKGMKGVTADWTIDDILGGDDDDF